MASNTRNQAKMIVTAQCDCRHAYLGHCDVVRFASPQHSSGANWFTARDSY